MQRHLLILTCSLLLSVAARAESGQPVINIKADRTIIYPPLRELYGTPVYGCLSVNKQFGKRWNLGIDWHDMLDAVCSQAEVNRHAANIKLQYRFE
jgi:hypothetical protein